MFQKFLFYITSLILFKGVVILINIPLINNAAYILYFISLLPGIIFKNKIDILRIEAIIDYLILPIIVPLSLKVIPDISTYLVYLMNVLIINLLVSKVANDRKKPNIWELAFIILGIFQIYNLNSPVFSNIIIPALILLRIYIYLDTKRYKINLKGNWSFFILLLLVVAATHVINAKYVFNNKEIIITLVYSFIVSILCFSSKSNILIYISSLICLFFMSFSPLNSINLDNNLSSYICIISLILFTRKAYLFNKYTEYGKISLVDDKKNQRLVLLNDNVIHGYQYKNHLRSIPTSYYTIDGPFGGFFESLITPYTTKKIAVIGLGVGTIAAYGVDGQEIDFYEINPAVIKISQEYCSYIKDSKARINIIEGDARINLSLTTKKYDLIIIDAFCGKEVPTKFLSYEAFQLYIEKLTINGKLLFNLSSDKFIENISRLLSEFKLISYISTSNENNKLEIVSDQRNLGLVRNLKKNKYQQSSLISNINLLIFKFFEYFQFIDYNSAIKEKSLWLAASLSFNDLCKLQTSHLWERVKENYESEIINDSKII